jgi:hypothetical protein
MTLAQTPLRKHVCYDTVGTFERCQGYWKDTPTPQTKELERSRLWEVLHEMSQLAHKHVYSNLIFAIILLRLRISDGTRCLGGNLEGDSLEGDREVEKGALGFVRHRPPSVR